MWHCQWHWHCVTRRLRKPGRQLFAPLPLLLLLATIGFALLVLRHPPYPMVYNGSGLGLAICQRLANLMHGELHAESEWQVGSVFTFTIPLATAFAEAAPK